MENIEKLQLILTSITALAAIIAPIITSIISARSQNKLKEIELYQATTAKQLSAFTSAYAAWKAFPRNTEEKKALTAAAYELALYVNDKDIQRVLINFGFNVSNLYLGRTDTFDDSTAEPLIESLFQELMKELANQNQTKRKR